MVIKSKGSYLVKEIIKIADFNKKFCYTQKLY